MLGFRCIFLTFSKVWSIVSHLFLFYIFICLITGLVALSIAGTAYLKHRDRLIRSFLYFYGAFTWLVLAKFLVSYADFYLEESYPQFFLLFVYFESFLGKFLLMMTFPIFIHALTQVPRESFRNAWIIGITLFTFTAQHLTEYILQDKRLDQWGDYFEDIVFFAVITYTFTVGHKHFSVIQEKIPYLMNKYLQILMGLYVPGLINDLFLADQSPWRFYPLFYAAIGLCLAPLWLRWTRPEQASPTLETRSYEAHGLSKREGDIVDLVLLGKNNQDIADSLFISLSTVKTHLRNIFRKLEVSSRYEVMALFGQGSQNPPKPNENKGSTPKG